MVTGKIVKGFNMSNNKESGGFFDNFLFQKIFQAFRIAIHPKSLLIAFFSLAIIWCAGRLFDIKPTVVTDDNGTTELDMYLQNPEQLATFISENSQSGTYRGVFETIWQTAFGGQLNSTITSLLQFDVSGLLKILNNYVRIVQWTFLYHPIYAVVFTILKLAVIAIGGGAICRIAALQFARGEKPGLFEAVWFSIRKLRSFFAAPLVPLGIIFLMGLFISAIGLLADIPYVGPLVLGVLMPLALLWGLLAAIIAAVFAVGFGLMFPVIAYEGTDSFDSASRSFSYIFAKPWRILFYDSIAFVYGLICYIFVRFFAFLSLFITRGFLKLSIFTDSSDKSADTLTTLWPALSFYNFTDFSATNVRNLPESISAILILINLLIVSGLVLSFLVSFFFSANTVIYALIRNQVDGTGISDIYIHPEDNVIAAEAKSCNVHNEE